jgi:hypothetical protein
VGWVCQAKHESQLRAAAGAETAQLRAAVMAREKREQALQRELRDARARAEAAEAAAAAAATTTRTVSISSFAWMRRCAHSAYPSKACHLTEIHGW